MDIKKIDRLDKTAKLSDLWAQNILDNAKTLSKMINGKTDRDLIADYIQQPKTQTTAPTKPEKSLRDALTSIARLTETIRKKYAIAPAAKLELRLLTDTDIIEEEIPEKTRASFIFTGATDYGVLRLSDGSGENGENWKGSPIAPDYGLAITVENATRFRLTQTISTRRVCLLVLFKIDA